MTTRTARTRWFAFWSVLLSSRRSAGLTGFLFLVLVHSVCQPAMAQPATDAAIHRVRIKDVATIEGIRDNQLVGYGIVVGLSGTGDSQQTVFPVQTLIS